MNQYLLAFFYWINCIQHNVISLELPDAVWKTTVIYQPKKWQRYTSSTIKLA